MEFKIGDKVEKTHSDESKEKMKSSASKRALLTEEERKQS
jgi:hypothetical protein